MTKQDLDLFIERVMTEEIESPSFQRGTDLLAPLLLEAMEQLQYVSSYLQDGYIVDNTIAKIEEAIK